MSAVTVEAPGTRLARNRARLAELEAERDAILARQSTTVERESEARYQVLRDGSKTRPGADAAGPVQRILRERKKDQSDLPGIEADLAAVRRLVAEDGQEARAQAAETARAELADVCAADEEATREGVRIFGELVAWYADVYIPAARTLEEKRLEVFAALQAAGVAADWNEWASTAPGWTLPSIPRTFRAALATFYDGAARTGDAGLMIARATGDLIPPIVDFEQEFRGDTTSHAGRGWS